VSGIAAGLTPLVGAAGAALVQSAYTVALRQDAQMWQLGYKMTTGPNTFYSAYNAYNDRQAANADVSSYGVVYTYALSQSAPIERGPHRASTTRALGRPAPGPGGFLAAVRQGRAPMQTNVASGSVTPLLTPSVVVSRAALRGGLLAFQPSRIVLVPDLRRFRAPTASLVGVGAAPVAAPVGMAAVAVSGCAPRRSAAPDQDEDAAWHPAPHCRASGPTPVPLARRTRHGRRALAARAQGVGIAMARHFAATGQGRSGPVEFSCVGPGRASAGPTAECVGRRP